MAAESGELIGACEFMKGEEQPPGILRPFHATPPTTPHRSPLCPKPLRWVSLRALCPSVLRLGARAPSRYSTPRGPPASGFFFAFSLPLQLPRTRTVQDSLFGILLQTYLDGDPAGFNPPSANPLPLGGWPVFLGHPSYPQPHPPVFPSFLLKSAKLLRQKLASLPIPPQLRSGGF